MAIKPRCEKCRKELKGFGGILLGSWDKTGRPKKFHLCPACYGDISHRTKLKFDKHGGKSDALAGILLSPPDKENRVDIFFLSSFGYENTLRTMNVKLR